MAKRKLTFRAVVLGVLWFILLGLLFGGGAGLLVVLARAISDELLVRAAVFLLGLPFVLYVGVAVTAPLAGFKAPSLGTFLRHGFSLPARRSGSSNPTVDSDARKRGARGSP